MFYVGFTSLNSEIGAKMRKTCVSTLLLSGALIQPMISLERKSGRRRPEEKGKVFKEKSFKKTNLGLQSARRVPSSRPASGSIARG